MAAAAARGTLRALFPLQRELDTALEECVCHSMRDTLMRDYLCGMERREDELRVPEFPQEVEWLNTERALSLSQDLCGKLVLLDFWTYCCINCLHVLPELKQLEERFSVEDGLVVVGVHSAKFPNEKSGFNVGSAVLRYGITHAVLNDVEAHLWHALDVSCWPTLVLLGPRGSLLFCVMGEGQCERLCGYISAALQYYREKGELRQNASLPLRLYKDTLSTSILSFPGKITLDRSGERLVVADTGHHRVLILTVSGRVLHCVGGPTSGWRDGNLSEALFHSPQGVAIKGDDVYVADTENHLIRKIDLQEGKVVTVGGLGTQGTDKEGGALGLQQPISSPWDVALGSAGGEDNMLWIAMAGTHQIWALFLEDGKLPKGRTVLKGTCVRFAGSGSEENRNNSYPHKASFAQPSGVTVADEPWECLFVADSESSTIRSVSTRDGSVKHLLGGERDPLNLFAFGDVDGVGLDVKLQHPLGVCWEPCSQKLYIADSYNHKIKVADPKTKQCRTLAGSGDAGDTVGLGLLETCFREPGGLCVSRGGGAVYVADTNNNSIKVLDLQTHTVSLLPLIMDDVLDTPVVMTVPRMPRSALRVVLSPAAVSPGQNVTLSVSLSLPDGTKLTPEAPSFWALSAEGGEWLQGQEATGNITDVSNPLLVPLVVPVTAVQATHTLNLGVCVYYCGGGGTCMMRAVSFQLPLQIGDTSPQRTTEVTLTHRF